MFFFIFLFLVLLSGYNVLKFKNGYLKNFVIYFGALYLDI